MNPPLFASLLFLVGGLAACDSDDVEGPDPITTADLAGTWTCTQFLVTSIDDPGVQFELISLGGSLNAIVVPDGSFTGQVSFPDPDTGQILMVPHEDVTDFDFDFDWNIDPATFDATLVRSQETRPSDGGG